MQGFKLPNRKRLMQTQHRSNSLDPKSPKLPRLFQSKIELCHTLEISSLIPQRSRHTRSNKENSNRENRHAVNSVVAEPPRLRHTFNSFSVEGVQSPQHVRADPPVIKKPSPRPIPVTYHLPVKMPSEGEIRHRLHSDWLEMLRAAHGLYPVDPTKTYKFYIGKGNNSHLVGQILKSRWWWCSTENPAEANFVWTQLKHRPTIDKLTSLAQVQWNDTDSAVDAATPRVKPALLQSRYQVQGFNLIRHSEYYTKSTEVKRILPNALTVHNRLPKNSHICSKKRLLKTMREFYTDSGTDVFTKIPLTFHVSSVEDPQMEEFANQHWEGSLWIVKPGEGTNRGFGIKVLSDLSEIRMMVASAAKNRSYIIQKYISNPLLLHKRKFDIRCFGLISCIGSQIQGYFYKEGYIRTASREFSLKKTEDKYIHLTNDAIQKKSEDYGKFETSNKLSYAEFQKYLSATIDVDFYSEILPRIQQAVADSMKAVYKLLDKANNTFEIFGYDFMIDEDLNVWLIEVNTNPCLDLACVHLAKTIPAMLDNAFRIVLDPLFTAPSQHKKFKHWVQETNIKNEFELVFSG